MLLPYSTDAPIYHYPVATVSLIVINVIFFFAFCLGIREKSIADIDYFTDSSGRKVTLEELDAKYQSEKPLGSSETSEAADYLQGLQPVFRADSIDWQESLMLEYGKIRPWQWVTCLFMHADIGHLVGNMIFLWAFGLVLEGKLGWLLFSGVYLAMGVFQSFAEQVLGYFVLQGASLGASGAIFSLLALVLIFAPLNSFETVLLLGRIFFIEVPILVFGGIYLAMNLFFFYASGASFGTEALHLIGFAVGVPVGLIMLTRGYVDCEGYDIISHFTEKKGKESQVGKKQRRMREKMKRAKEDASLPRTDPVQRNANLAAQVDQAIQEGNVDLAVALQTKIAANNPGFHWSQDRLAQVIQFYIKQKQWAKVEPLIEKHLELFEQHRFPLQVKLLKIWLQAERPRHALRYMQGLNGAFLSEAEKNEIKKLAEYAKQQIRSGVIE